MSKNKAAFSKKNFTSTPMRYEFDKTSVLNLTNDNDDVVYSNDIPFGDVTPNFNSSFKYLRTESPFSSSSTLRINNQYLGNKFDSSKCSQRVNSQLLISTHKKKPTIFLNICFKILRFFFLILNCFVIAIMLEYFYVPQNFAFNLWNFFDYKNEKDKCF